VSGDVAYNAFTVSGNGLLSLSASRDQTKLQHHGVYAYGWYSEGASQIDGDFAYNEFDLSSNHGDAYALRTAANFTIGSVSTNQFKNNTFTLTNNEEDSIGLSIEANATFQGSALTDSFVDNNISVTGTGVTNYGMSINMKSGNVTDFKGAFTSNTVVGTGDANSYGLFLNTKGGSSSIEFEQNAEASFSADNNGMVINNYGGDSVNFGL
jgi:hypothetical protein